MGPKSAINDASTVDLSPADEAGPSRATGHRSGIWILLSLVFLAQAIFFQFVALHRFVDGDEGFYLLASRLVLLHKRPYLDFFYTQAPLLPYVYASWMKVTGVSWISAKTFAALLTATLGTLLCEEVWHQTRNWLSTVSIAILFSASSLIFGFYPVVKTFSLAGLFLFLAYIVVTRASAESPHWLIPAGGLCLGLSVATRSYLVVALPVYLWWLIRNCGARSRMTTGLRFMCGFVVGVIPCIYLFAISPSAFLFNNLGYHAVRSEWGLVGMWEQKFVALLQALLGSGESNGLQTSLLLFISMGFISCLSKEYPSRFALQVAVTIAVVSLLPTPVHPQYFCLCIPFLLVSACCAVTLYVHELHSRNAKILGLAACVLVVAIYVAASLGDFRRYLATGVDVAGAEPGLEDDLRLQHVLDVSSAIDRVAKPGAEVASFWPGFIFQTRAVPYPGFENDFALPIADQLTPEQRSRYHILSVDDIEADFAASKPEVVVLRDHVIKPTTVEYRQKVRALEDTFRTDLQQHGYKLIESVGDISIYSAAPRS
jgi:hypothetical protein